MSLPEAYEYVRIDDFDWGDLDTLNRLALAGFRVVAVDGRYALLERRLTETARIAAFEHAMAAVRNGEPR